MLTEDIEERVYPVGRLDKNSEGLLILTNDGEFANMLSHPKTHVSKTYRVTVRPPVTDEMLNALMNGVKLDDGYVTAPAEATIASQEDNRIVILMTIYEGKNRQIRRMFESLNKNVVFLKRIAIGSLKLGSLKRGEVRQLKREDIVYLKSL